MIEELKTEDIVGYLPFKLEIMTESNEICFLDIINVSETIVAYPKNQKGRKKGILTFLSKIKPKLIPLHSLTPDQLVHFSICFRLWYDKPNFDYKLMIYQDIETCHKLHVDYRGLIEKELAIVK